jgi:hypothetical protein
MVRVVHEDWGIGFARGGIVPSPEPLEGVEITNFGDPVRRVIEPDQVEWSIGQSRASYLAGTIHWWELEDEIEEALNGRIPYRLVPLQVDAAGRPLVRWS